MSRKHYGKADRDFERKQLARQEELTVIGWELCGQGAEPTAIPFINEAKERRRARLEQKRRHKAKHEGGAADIDQE